MEQVREVKDREPVEAWVEAAAVVAVGVEVSVQDPGGSAFVPTAVKRWPTSWVRPVMNGIAPSAVRL